MDRIFEAMAEDPENLIPIIMFILMGIVGAIALIGGYCATVANTRQREQTRREIAAYIAEGNMTADEGERLLKAGQGSKCGKHA